MFLHSLSGGMLLATATGRVHETAWRFLRLVGIITLAIACGVTVREFTDPSPTPTSLSAWTLWIGVGAPLCAMAIVFLAPLVERVPNTFRIVCFAGGMAGLTAGAMAALPMLDPRPASSVSAGAVVVSQLLGGFLIGTMTIAWLLGHAYLTATKMTIAPLRHFSRLLLWAVGLRIVFVAVSLVIAWAMNAGDGQVLLHLRGAWIPLLMRIGVGLVSVGLFAYMVADCVKLQSTQSATGILYFGSVCAYVGELANLHIVSECGWPL